VGESVTSLLCMQESSVLPSGRMPLTAPSRMAEGEREDGEQEEREGEEMLLEEGSQEETIREEMGDQGICNEDRSGDRNSEQKLQLCSDAVMAFITASSNISQP
jgi:hypothetical protein